MLEAVGGAGLSSATAVGGGQDRRTIDASRLIAQATDPKSGAVDTRALAQAVHQAAGVDPKTASAAYGEVEHALSERSPADASRFNSDVQDAFRTSGDAAAGLGVGASKAGGGLSAAGAARTAEGAGLTTRGAQLLKDNPLLSKQWVSTRSLWTGKGGFTSNLQTMLKQHGIAFDTTVRPPPAGSLGKGSGVPLEKANNVNGALGRDSIAKDLQASGASVSKEVPVPGTGRRIDVRGDYPANANSPARRVDVESKVGRKGADAETRAQVIKDGQDLAANRATRTTAEGLLKDGEAAAASGRTLSTAGKALDVGGKVLKPLAIAADGAQLYGAFKADGNKVGVNTGRTASGVAGSWAGAAAGAEVGAEAGAAIGSVVPGAGTVVGGVVGGLIGGAAGAFVGDGVGRKAFDTVKSWF